MKALAYFALLMLNLCKLILAVANLECVEDWDGNAQEEL